VAGATGSIVLHTFGHAAAAGIRALSKGAFATPFAAVLAGLQIVFARGGAGPDVSVGVVAANRTSAREQRLVGYTANLCITRALVTDDDTIEGVVRRARDTIWGLLGHQAVPYPVVFGALTSATQHALGATAPVLLSYLGPIGQHLRLGEVRLTLLRTPNRAARADMAMSISEVDGGYRAELEFNTGRYDPETVFGLLHDLESVLAAGVDDPTRRVGSLQVSSRTVAGGARSATQKPATGAFPVSAVWARVVEAWTELLDHPPATPDSDFFAAGGHSLAVVRLAAALEESDIHIDVAEWLTEPTVRALVAQTAAAHVEDRFPGSTVVELRAGEGPHLHLVHGAAGDARAYRSLLAALPANWRVTLSQEREPLTSIQAMARRYRTDLEAAGLHPDVLGGWSMGGQVAFEMVSEYSPPVPALVLLDSTPPGFSEPDGDLAAVRIAAFGSSVCESFGIDHRSLPRTAGDPGLRIGVLAAYLGCLGQQVSADVLMERWQTFDRHSRAAVEQVARDPVDVPALVVGADLLDSQMQRWVELVGPAAEVVRVDADHYGLLSGRVAEQLAEAIIGLHERTAAERTCPRR
jgi:thioesterase domain-containing protein